MPDWIETFILDTNELNIEERFRTWTGIAIIAGVLERRVWTETDRGLLFPNQFIILSGHPASGKSLMVNEASNHWSQLNEFHIGPENPTRSAFLAALEKSQRNYINGNVEPVIYTAMSLASSELGVLFATGEKEFFQTLTDLYDNKNKFRAPRTSTHSIDLDRPTVNIVGGATPGYLHQTFPDIAWEQGFTSRLIFVYGAEIHDPNRDVLKKRQKSVQNSLRKDLETMFQIYGEFIWEPAAHKALNDWFSKKLPPVPDHPRLSHYCGRRGPHVMKLAMISAISRSKTLTVTLADFERAQKWLLEAEEFMPEVFKAMRAKSDDQLIIETYQEMYSQYSSVLPNKRQPIKESDLWHYIRQRTTSERIPRIVEAMERSNLIRRGPQPGTYIPQPKVII